MGVSLDLIIWQPQAQGIAVFELDALSVIAAPPADIYSLSVNAAPPVK